MGFGLVGSALVAGPSYLAHSKYGAQDRALARRKQMVVRPERIHPHRCSERVRTTARRQAPTLPTPGQTALAPNMLGILYSADAIFLFRKRRLWRPPACHPALFTRAPSGARQRQR